MSVWLWVRRDGGLLSGEFLGLLAFDSGVGGASLPGIGVGEDNVGLGVGGVGGDGGLELGNGFGELAALEEGASAV